MAKPGSEAARNVTLSGMYFVFDTTHRNMRVSHKGRGDKVMLENLKRTF